MIEINESFIYYTYIIYKIYLVYVIKMTSVIKVTSEDKISSIRVRESTKRLLESFTQNGDTQEETLLKLLNLLKNTLSESSTKFIKQNNITGVKYGSLSKRFDIDIEDKRYAIVCTFNDLTSLNILPYKKDLQEYIKEWEIDLKIVNISTDVDKYHEKSMVTWKDPQTFRENNKRDYLLLYFIAIKQVLEFMFGIKINEIVTSEDYFNTYKWKEAYSRNNLSMDSYYHDIEEELR